MSKVVKTMELEAIRKEFAGVKDMVVMGVGKLDCTADQQFRANLRKKMVRVKRIKNSMARKVLGEQGIKIAADSPYFAGTTLYAWSSVSGMAIAELCRAIDGELTGKQKASYKDKLILKGAVAEGLPISFDIAKKLPTRLEAIANVVGMMLAPAGKIVSQLRAPGANLASQIKTISEMETAAVGA
ncbi:MAG: 50S ribosomal protein L10 [Planctomycetota bacterium]|nr:50S ribosomal protein L10 [Planctomycetota bacterium]RLT00208.1 MAG: 50S ribosomal protein L10 [Planctomycetota bacterium]